MKIVVSCANGAGSSLMIKLKTEKVCKDLGIKADIHHCPLSEGKSVAINYDVVLTAKNFVNMFDYAAQKGVLVIGLVNIMSEAEIKQAIQTAIDKGIK